MGYRFEGLFSPFRPGMSVLVKIVVGRTQQRLRPSDVVPVADGDLPVPIMVGTSEAIFEREGA